MSSARETLSKLRRSGASVRVSSAGKLQVRAPKGVLTAELRGELERHKAEILELLGAGPGGEAAPGAPIVRRGTDGPAPLSFAQQRLWFLQRFSPENASYNLGSAWRLRGPLDEGVLLEALGHLVERHEVLRTVFPEDDGVPVQRVLPAGRVSRASHDLSAVPADEREAAVRRGVEVERQRPFRLEREPPLRVSLWRLADDDHVLLLVLHHIGGDGWSLGVLHRELSACWTAARTGQPLTLPDLPVQYADFAAWERAARTSEALAPQLEHWARDLAGAAPLPLPTDHPRPPRPSFAGARESVVLPAGLVRALEALGHEQGASLFMTLLSGFDALLQRVAAEDDLVVGVPTSSRARTELEGLVGCFQDMLALRTDCGGDPPFRELLGRVRATCLEAFRHQDVPFESVVERLGGARDTSRNPLFQVFFAMQDARDEAPRLADLRVEPFAFEYGTTDLDLDVFVAPVGDDLQVSFLYATDLFGAASVRSLADAYAALLRAAVARPDARLSQLSLVDAEGIGPGPGLFLGPSALSAPGDRIHHRFVRHAQATPDRVAVVFEGEAMTYGELHERSGRLATHLRGLGVGDESLVGIAVDRGPDMLVGLLAILRAGGAYVPIDPDYPCERIAWMLEDSRVEALVSQRHVAKGLPAFDGALVLLDDTDWMRREPLTDESAGPAQADALAYVIHTSGSTGRPKGVEVPHGAVVNFLESMAQRPGCGPDDNLLAVTTLSFDIAGLELFLPLSVGARVEIVTRELAGSGHGLARRLDAGDVTLMQATPATWQMLLHAGWDGCPGLVMLCGGEALPRTLADGLLERGGALWNMYGPTESTIWSAVCRVQPGVGPVPLGEPIHGTQLLVLDGELRPVPRGMPGELFIAGAGLARGYLRRPELTASRFGDSPWADVVPGRLYRTGDLVRLDAAGRLMFLGRVDHQVKLRGHRIELGEVEARLEQQDGVRQAAVIVHEDAPESRRLVAFWLAEEGAVTPVAALREGLRRTLPGYMLPSGFVRLDELPLTPAGKIDRRGLAGLVPDLDANEATSTAPRGPLEDGVHDAFRELLGRERIDVHEDFFEAGGHSLLATRLVSRLRRLFGVELLLSQVFETPTVAGIARCVETLRVGDGPAPPGAIPAVPRDEPLALSFAQQRLWLLDQMGAGAGYHMRLELGLSGSLDRDALRQALDAVVARHEVLRTRFIARGETPLQVIDSPSPLPLRVFEHPEARDAEQRVAALQAYAEQDGACPFDLARGPLLRAGLLVFGADEALLVLSFHHVVADGRSYELLAHEIAAHYRALAGGEPLDLHALPVQYADFAAWQRQWLAGERMDAQLRWWAEHLAGDLPVLELPTDRPRPPVQSFDGAAERMVFEPELLEGLRALARDQGATLAMVSLAAFCVLLSRCSGQRRVLVGSPVANRTRSDVEHLIGFFVNALVLGADLSDDPTFDELLRRVKADSLDAYDHQDLPFERLVDELAPERDPSRTPLFQAVFAMNLLEEPDLDGAGLRVRSLPPEISVTRFDLELHLFEGSGSLEATWVYATALFDADTMARMARQYHALLRAVVVRPRTPVSALPLIDDQERAALLREATGPRVEVPGDGCLHRLVEAQVRERPDAVAAVYHDEALTYAELDARANQLAHRLQEAGACRDMLIGLCVARGLDLVVGLLGILKAGAAYVPLDPAYPVERLAFMMRDSGLALLVTQERLLDGLPEHEARVLRLDDAGLLDDAPTHAPAVDSRPSDLAYAIFTSGSSGTPKAALLEHAGLCNLSHEQSRAFGVKPGARVLQFSSLSFDAATFEVVMALPKGAALILGDREELLPGPDLVEFLGRHAVEIVTLPPTALAAMPQAELPALRTITVAGEACAPDLVRRWAPGRRFFNLYGPTETTIWATTAELRPDEPVHIGWPLGNVSVYLLDERGEPVPAGLHGELCIGGAGVARGYLARPELTAERFVDDPFAPAPGDPHAPRPRLFRTGDLGRRRADGGIEFIGRMDHQVKLRGHRIEPGEVESVLEQLPDVQDSLVMVREDVPGDRRLVAYVVHDPDAAPVSDDIEREREHVAHWRTLYEESYGTAPDAAERTFNVTSWDSSYTGAPLPVDEMRAWLDHTVTPILAAGPRRVLELGCGLGLILFRVAPHCAEYVGTDISQAALDGVRRQLGELPPGAAEVRLERREADALDDLPGGHFDCVVLNSVAQYLPGTEALLRVLEGAVRVVRPGGRVFIGDVRSLPLMEAFHASIVLHQADDSAELGQLRERVRQRVHQEQELLVSPAFFEALRARVPRVCEVRLEPKRGGYDNELSRFRYDVVVFLDEAPAGGSPPRGSTWGEVGTVGALATRLAECRDDVLGVRDVPNRRTLRHATAARRLLDEHATGTRAELLASVAESAAGVEPDELRALANDGAWSCELSWRSCAHDGRFDAIFRRVGAVFEGADPAAGVCAEDSLRPWADYGNRPLRARQLGEVVSRLRQHVTARLPESMIPAAFVVLDAFPVTPNGKLDREALPPPDSVRPLLADAYEAPRTLVERQLAGIWARALGLDRVGVRDDFFELGGDSILCIHVVAAARAADVVFSARDLFQNPTIRGLAAHVQGAGAALVPAEQGAVTGPLPWLPIQRWFLEGDPVDPEHFTQALLLEPTVPLEVERLRRALRAVCAHHDALRLRVQRGPDGWSQELGPLVDEVPLEVHDLSGLDDAARAASLDAHAARVQSGHALDSGVMLAAALFRADDRPDVLLLSAHHLAVDAVSWTPLLQDLGGALASTSPAGPALPAKTSSLAAWAQALGEYARGGTVARQARHWLGLPWTLVKPLPVDHPDADDLVADVRFVRGELDAEHTRALLHGVTRDTGAGVDELLLTALARTLTGWTGAAAALVDVEGHGRQELLEGLDVSRTVGWFTSIHPQLLRVDGGSDVAADLDRVRAQLAGTPDRGLPYGLARYLSGDVDLAAELAALPRAQVAFNYLGDFDQAVGITAFRWLGSPNGSSRSPRARRPHSLEVQAVVRDGVLEASWGYGAGVCDRPTVQALADAFLAELRGMSEGGHLSEPSAPPDVAPGAGFDWSEEELSELIDEADKHP